MPAPELFQHGGPVGPKPRRVIAHPGDRTHGSEDHARRSAQQPPAPWHPLFPCARNESRRDDDVVSRLEPLDHQRDELGRMRVVGVHRDHHVTVSRSPADLADPRPDRGGEPAVALVPDHLDRQPACHRLRHRGRVVAAAVVHHQDSEAKPPRPRRADAAEERREVLGLIVGGEHEPHLGPGDACGDARGDARGGASGARDRVSAIPRRSHDSPGSGAR